MNIVANDAIAFPSGLSADDLRSDLRTLPAVALSLLLVGELAATPMDKYLAIASKHTDIPWRAMRGMRNRIAHNYFSLETDIIWETVDI